jgi:hypothetical protein
MINKQSSFHHHFFKIAVAQSIAQIPAHAEENNISLKMAPLEGILVLVAHGGDLFRSFLSTVSDQLSFLQHNPQEHGLPEVPSITLL